MTSLRKKALIIIGGTIITLFIILYTASHSILLNSYITLEEKNTRTNVDRALNGLSVMISHINNITGDYAAWDDTYEFIYNFNEGYIESSLNDYAFIENDLNFILYLDNLGQLVFSKGFDLNEGRETPVIDSIMECLTEKDCLFNHEDTNSRKSGVVLLPEGPLLMASRPIITSEGQGPIRGTLVMARFLDNNKIAELSHNTNLSLSIIEIDIFKNTEDYGHIYPAFEENKIVIKAEKQTIEGYSLINDIFGNPALVLKIDMPRNIYNQGHASINFFNYAFMASGLIIFIIGAALLEVGVLTRLTTLSQNITNIGSTGKFSSRVPVAGNDELSKVAHSINDMLESLDVYQQKLQESEIQYRRLFYESLSGNYITSPEGEILLCNPAFARVFGYASAEEIMADNAYSFYKHQNDRDLYVELIKNKKKLEFYECDLMDRFGKPITVVENVIGIFNDQGELIQLQGYLIDITERKQMEKQLKYLSLHDSLTGLYNRTYFEQEMNRLEGNRFAPVGIIMCDVDGLKLVNDTLGHDKGDQLLLTAANVIKSSFREGDMVARIGGDEFAILLPKTSKPVVEVAVKRIRDAIFNYNQTNPELVLSISIGFAVSDETVDITQLFKEADNNMYREKLLRSQSNRSAIVHTLMKALEARDFITEGHADRLQHLVTDMAVAMSIPEHKLIDLKLFTQFHDIGKVGIPDHILFKPGPHDPEESAQMKRHCEIGYRIAQSAPDLVPIADWILKHHEWWNGNGYPLGLKGEEIPLECRILAIADAYDAMTNNRPYRKALSHDDAVRELKRCAGTQFDPNLVDVFIEVAEKTT